MCIQGQPSLRWEGRVGRPSRTQPVTCLGRQRVLHTGLVLGQEGVPVQAAALGRGPLGCRRSPQAPPPRFQLLFRQLQCLTPGPSMPSGRQACRQWTLPGEGNESISTEP